MQLQGRVPPGRAGRLWLHRRLLAAQRGRDQLDRRLRVLLPELERRRAEADRQREQWSAAQREAETWLLRAVLLGGQDVLRHADAAPAQATVTWTAEAGVRLPAGAEVHRAPPVAPTSPGNAAMTPAAAASRAALDAAVRTAVAEEAVRRLADAVALTRRRLRALDAHWLPALVDALAALELSLAQVEQEDGTRLRRALSARPAVR